ncbi:protein of unknown function [endosymbiont DhMRE of Dentiscutata heterogama]|uniref:hypothetical protein n=1 Tax=endosymbiont DhMRE of Dentiscutata heterogama TaxID=1609546 RepID=UPI000629DD0F|nr:hypothetical protein [endosymbiont DhMRE of Dentiscutata heterogama]CFW92848.1 protein of unknown function [endosymbiont DhMRE of Dentiscutata heterogama]
MVNWKNFKNWLEKEVVISDGLKVKIRPEKQVIYGELSEIVLTNFCDSLEATLDQNGSYHLFPDFANKKFGELFVRQNCCFGKRTNQNKIDNNDWELLEKLFDDWKRSQNRTELAWWYEREYKLVDEFLGNRGTYYVDADGYIYNDLDITFRIKQKEVEVNWLKEKLKNILGEEQYQARIETNYPTKFLQNHDTRN